MHQTIALLFTVIAAVFAVRGVDMSLQQSQTAKLQDYLCLVRNGYEFAIIEVWNGGYQYNTKIKDAVDLAWQAGFKHVDVYAFMCPNCRGNAPAANAVRTIIENLQSAGVVYGQIWFDVEQCSGCWNGVSQNCNFVAEAVAQAEALLGASRVGVYSSKYEWEQTVGTCAKFSQYSLWYAHYDQTPAFNDQWAWQFGGWTKPAIKQYNDRGAGCGIDVDLNYYPDSLVANRTTTVFN